MIIKSLAIASAGFVLVAAPVAASAAPANPASGLSVSKPIRAGTSTSKSSKLSGMQGASIAPIVIGVGILAGVAYLIVDHENDDDSDSN